MLFRSEQVMAAFKLPKDTEGQLATRIKAVDKATLHAAELPLNVAKQALHIMELGINMMMRGNVNAISDAASAVSLGFAAMTASGLNVKINVNALTDKTPGQPLLLELAEIEKKAQLLNDAVTSIIKDRAGF